jgi:hypothetical protein
MSTFRLAIIGLCLFLLSAMSVPRARADEWNQETKVTFSGPVEVPGRVLPAGTYTFTLMNDDADRDIVQIWDANRMHLFATILAVPDYRMKPAGKPIISFEERKRTSPEALHAWFYPGDSYGHEFVYPESRAIELAKRTGQPVLSMRNELASNITQPAKSAKEPSVMAMKQEHVKKVQPSGQEVEMAQNTPPPMPAASPKSLPQTASLLPLWAGLGVLLLGASLTLQLIVKSMP